MHGVHALVWAGGVRGHAEGFKGDLGPAALAYLQVHFGSFADDHDVRIAAGGNFTRGNAFKAFFMHNACNIN